MFIQEKPEEMFLLSKNNLLGLLEKIIVFLRKPWHVIFYSAFILILAFALFPIKAPFQNVSYATILRDQNGRLLGGITSNDQQWRFPPGGKIPDKYIVSLLMYEDKNFYYHPGVDPAAVLRALYLNFKTGAVVSGGSTITMQIARLSRGKNRTVKEKIIEALLALKYELKYSKKEILSLYASHAPYGGNIVGLDAAVWRYYGRDADSISWAEAALLAVLPNSPSLLFPGRNDDILLAKRDGLLKRLFDGGKISENEYELALLEPLPDKPYPMPQDSYHLLMRTVKDGNRGKNTVSTIDENLQLAVDKVVNKHGRILSESRVFNVSAIVVSVNTGNVLSYVGNTRGDGAENRGNSVDIIPAPRSSGSILKPFLYAFMLDEGHMLPDQLLPDIPLNFKGFTPQNYYKEFCGALPASSALTKSLNVPFVYLLHQYGYQKFHHRMSGLGMKLPFSPSHYSLSLILGGAETNLWELSEMYAGLARSLKFPNADKQFFSNNYIMNNTRRIYYNEKLSPSSVWFTFNAMKELSRPYEENRWRDFSSSKPIAWKTGTSFGNRDAWAVGVTPDYVIAVWCGNASGEGRPEITGVTAAGPILLEIHNFLTGSPWFYAPSDDMIELNICNTSGHIASRFCDSTTLKKVPALSYRGEPCPYHKLIHLDSEEKFQADSSNHPVSSIVSKKYFVLPPVQEFYYMRRNPSYRKLPPKKTAANSSVMDFIYPNTSNTNIFIPIELDGTRGNSIFEIAHRENDAIIYWHLNGEYLGSTVNIHQMAISPPQGENEVTAVDGEGNVISREFKVSGEVKRGY